MTEEITRENYLRVTNILYPFSGLDKIDADIVANAAVRGTKVHNICESIAKGYGEFGVEDETWGYVNSFKKWFETNPEILFIEKRFWDDELKITGQIDFICKIDGKIVVVDLKTSSKESKTWPVQGAAYAYLAKKSNHDVSKIHFIHLNRNGLQPKIFQYNVDDSLFLHTFRVYNHFYREKSNG